MEMQKRLPQVLMYHSVSRRDDYDALCVSPERFGAQMRLLKRLGLRGVCMRDLNLAASSGSAMGLVGVTFDDGYEDFLHGALPTLEALGFSATVFVVAGRLGEENSWEHRDGDRPRLRLMDADGVKEVAERGMEVGAHTMTHPRLSGLDSASLEYEVAESGRILGEILGARVGGFCYPYGDLDGAAVQAVRAAGYDYACATKFLVEGSVYDWPRTFAGERDHPLRLGGKLLVRGMLPNRKPLRPPNSSR